uniref:Uncharacterized protein n=1 Tax=Kalanchoe fedtschenkoi TaxID=63787 RepID=A0A7N0VJA2_KALFE
MLLAVEGGGFFSSSATGYSKGLSLLFLGQKKEDKSTPMRVLPRNQYQLVDEDCEPDIQLASSKHHFARGCVSFVCFGRASTGLDSSQLKVGPTQQQGIRTVPPASINGKDESTIIRKENDSRKSDLKSSLRKRSKSIPRCKDNLQCEELFHKYLDDTCSNGRRSIQWTDVCGRELVEIREFIPSFFHFTLGLF